MTDVERREKVLIDALLEIRDLVSIREKRESEWMAIVDEAVRVLGYEPWRRRLPMSEN
jgi:hypothetical protein